MSSDAEQREREIRAATVGEPVRLDGPIALHEYDPHWAELYAHEAQRIRDALGDRVVLLEHCGSTSVPSLAAKPIIDIVLAVLDSADEPVWLPSLEAAGYVLRVRQPDWFEHRMLRRPDAAVHLHVFSDGCPEIDRMLLFRDTLRRDANERALYEQTKRELAAHIWRYMQDYADAKSAVVAAIMQRATDQNTKRR